MTRARLACIASAVSLLPLAVAGTAAAAPAVQEVGQSAGSHQVAGSSATSLQSNPTNSNISVRIGSPGNDGAVTQTNTSTAASAAGNQNATGQAASQSGGGAQTIGQHAGNAQAALSAAKSIQLAPKNENISVRIHSPGDNGPVEQSNTSSAHSTAGNVNATKQDAEQSARGPAEQTIGQHAGNDQLAKSVGVSAQKHPVNTNTPVKVGSPGSDGPVSQTNGSSARSAAGNANGTIQKAAQHAGGGADMLAEPCGDCHGGGTTVQAIGQDAGSEQSAGSAALSVQHEPVNENLGTGGGGPVSQANTSDASSAAGNVNATKQLASQTAGGGPGTLVQAIGQSAWNDQAAKSLAASLQDRPANINAGGGVGAVDQRNSSRADSEAGNRNATLQAAEQAAGSVVPALAAAVGCRDCGHGDTTVQAIGQDAWNKQAAWSEGVSKQICPLNEHHGPVIGKVVHRPAPKPGPGKPVLVPRMVPALAGLDQLNESLARSTSGNDNKTGQGARQRA